MNIKLFALAAFSLFSATSTQAGQWYPTSEFLSCQGCSSEMMANTALFGGGMGEHVVFDLQSGVIRSYRTVCGANFEEPCNPYASYVEEIPVTPELNSIFQDMRQFDQNYPGFLGSYSKSLVLYDFNIPTAPTGEPWSVVSIALDQPTAYQVSGANYNNFRNALGNWLGGSNAPAQVVALRSFYQRLTGINVGYQSVSVGVSLSPGSETIDLSVELNSGKVKVRYNAVSGQLEILEMLNNEGHPFPARRSGNQFYIDFGRDSGAAGAYGAVLQGAGVNVEQVGFQYIGNGATGGAGGYTTMTCTYNSNNVLQGCEIVYHQN